jgi:hypothetical protein
MLFVAIEVIDVPCHVSGLSGPGGLLNLVVSFPLEVSFSRRSRFLLSIECRHAPEEVVDVKVCDPYFI